MLLGDDPQPDQPLNQSLSFQNIDSDAQPIIFPQCCPDMTLPPLTSGINSLGLCFFKSISTFIKSARGNQGYEHASYVPLFLHPFRVDAYPIERQILFQRSRWFVNSLAICILSFIEIIASSGNANTISYATCEFFLVLSSFY